MKCFIRRSILLGASASCLLGASFLRADDIVKTTEFSEPGQYCFEQTSLRGKFDKTILAHHLIIPPEDHLKTGDVFVGFRRSSQPDALWLTDGSQWRAYNDNEFPYMAFKRNIRLEPVIKAEVFHAPKDVTEYVEDGEIWIGYGVRKDETETKEDSFQDMISNQRYYRVWRIGDLVVDGLNPEICLTTTQITERIRIVGTASSQ
ncbi:hypothetical protein [Methylobacter sp. YRD-M1]|uniref:hypothetical protein n=1 Tax=Methylobacter sp. YRD-M1 TaxID=2911520 RepID=UPI00227A47F4|nr:hypothetical protein [Methylobacter sp. YRD-M1]WAK03337.1 hypothetical protein LZ558_06030 [Methylobacter sp. YRD-M1]